MMRARRLFVPILVSVMVLVIGCSSGPLSNRLACSVSRDAAFVVSQYGSVGVSAKIDKGDARVLCEPQAKP